MNAARTQFQPGSGAPHRNPFPDVPEVRLDGTGADVAVETDAVRAVRLLAMDFLTARADVGGDPGRSGRVAAILGELGAGKSHLAWTLMDEIVRIAGTRPVVLVASGQAEDTVLSIYQRLLAPPGSGAGGRIRPVDTAAGVLLFGTVEKMVEDLCAGLRRAPGAEPEAPPPVASDELPVDVVFRLHRELMEIADGDEDLARVLRLVWHKAAGPAAWRWLCGARELPVEDERLLADRGVQAPPVRDGTRALKALRALARLCAWTGGRMVLVLDELHRIDPQGPARVSETLMDLIGWAGETGALLAVCGLIDFWEALPQAVHQRVTTRIVPAGLTVAQIRDYIRAALRTDDEGDDGPYPFGRGSVEELWKITDGHPRRTITLCHHAYERAAGTGSIGPRQIREASRSLCAPDTPDHVRGKLSARCIELGYHVERVRRQERSRWQPDLRVTSRRGDSECALVVSGAVLEDAELAELRTRASALMGNRRAHPRSVVLVMAGPLAAAFNDDVEDVFTRVLQWDSDTFYEDLAATLRSHVPVDDQTGLYELVAEVRRELGELRALGTAAASAVPDTGVAWTDPDRRRRFEQADRLCRHALEVITAADGKAREFWRARFHFEARGVAIPRLAAPGDRHVALGDVVSYEVLRARGALAFLADVVAEFSGRVRELLADERKSMPRVRDELRFLQGKLDHTLGDVIKMFPDEDERGTVGHLLGVDRPKLNQYLSGLGETVYSVVVAPGPEDGA
ncbi:hypothetical protein [Actinomadura chokoriensis]|uniref:AAA+ ATPase domain-containing protein n=1 Tax=Actinomadura chokoriensis TaxID=454156 RepID=A0ABV4QY67_9ACTN